VQNGTTSSFCDWNSSIGGGFLSDAPAAQPLRSGGCAVYSASAAATARTRSSPPLAAAPSQPKREASFPP
jgi:hypothetical protein